MKRLVRRLFATCWTVSLAACAQGCGLVVWPYAARHPDPVKQVLVVDARTGDPLSNAGVSYRVLPCDHLESDGASVDDEWPAYGGAARSGESHSDRLNDDPATLTYAPVDSSGRNTARSGTRWGLAQFWWPLPITYIGWIQFHGHEDVFVARAPGYRPKMVRFTRGGDELRWLRVLHGDTLVIALNPDDADSRNPTNPTSASSAPAAPPG